MKTLRDLKPGDRVIVVDVNLKRTRRIAVEKMGRVNIYLMGSKTAYDIETGCVKDGYGHARILTEEQHDLDQRVGGARTALSAFGVDVQRGVAPEKVLAIHDALRALMERMDPKAPAP